MFGSCNAEAPHRLDGSEMPDGIEEQRLGHLTSELIERELPRRGFAGAEFEQGLCFPGGNERRNLRSPFLQDLGIRR